MYKPVPTAWATPGGKVHRVWCGDIDGKYHRTICGRTMWTDDEPMSGRLRATPVDIATVDSGRFCRSCKWAAVS